MKKIVDEIDVNINAVRDFTKNFKNATDVKWVNHENGTSLLERTSLFEMRKLDKVIIGGKLSLSNSSGAKL